MEYSVSWLEETGPELQDVPKHLKAIKRKIAHIAANIPIALKLRGVQPTRGLPDGFFEVDVAGTRTAIYVDHNAKKVTVYMVGNEHYAYENYLKQAHNRLLRPPS